ncbi:MAG: hypothetical protein LQ340_006865, partial [Diploschistes diacapsis]
MGSAIKLLIVSLAVITVASPIPATPNIDELLEEQWGVAGRATPNIDELLEEPWAVTRRATPNVDEVLEEPW